MPEAWEQRRAAWPRALYEAIALLEEQRKRTDTALAAYRDQRRGASGDARFEAVLTMTDGRMDQLASQRRGVDGLESTVPVVLGWYSGTIRDFLRASTEVVKVVDDGSAALSVFT